ncbi:MAG TPA: tetratricopeptide repeat protein [bacterium]|nr:tetratricopeptide repeat protein [bacterium]
MSTVGGVDASAILPGGPSGAPWSGADPGSEGTSPEASLSVEMATGLSAPSLGAQFESDFLVVGTVNVADGLLLNYRVYEVEGGRVLRDGNITGLRSDVFRLLDELGRGVQRAIGYLPEDEEEDQDFNPVYDSVDFDSFTEFCLAREASLPRNALDHLERALRREPGFRMALVEYLSHCYQVDDLCHSLALMNAYLQECEDDQEILIAAANLCLAFNVVDEGLSYATSAFVRRPGDVEPRVLMARFLFAKEMSDDARAHLDAALRSPDPSPEAKYCLGRYFLDLGDVYRSRDYFEQCLEADPGYFVALRDLQCCYYELGDFAKGIDACERLLEADPTDAGSYYNLGLIYQRQGRTRLAMKYFEEAVRQDATFYKAVYMLGEHLYAQDDFEAALARFEEAHRLAPSSSEVLGRIADCHWELGRSKDALRHYAWARQEDPVFDSARYRLIEGAEASDRGELDAAHDHFLKATELNEELAEAWNELGGALLRLGRAEEALNVVRRAAELEPDHPSVLANLLTCLKRLPLGARFSGWARTLAKETRERLRRLRAVGVVPPAAGRRRTRRRLLTLTWYAFRG